MFPAQLKKILELIKTTGDRVIIYDAGAPDEAYAIMDLDNYRQIIMAQAKLHDNLTPGKSVVGSLLSTPIKLENSANLLKNENLTEEDLTDKINREISIWKNRDSLAYTEEEDKPKKAWQIPPQVKDKAQEVD